MFTALSMESFYTDEQTPRSSPLVRSKSEASTLPILLHTTVGYSITT